MFDLPEIKILETGSSGNFYSIQQDDQVLLVEAGAKDEKLIADNNVVGCLISHEHGDHAKYAHIYARLGIDCYMTPGTIAALEANHYRFRPIEYGFDNRKEVGDFTVVAFEVNHDAAEPAGFLIQAPGDKRILYVSDTSHIKYKFRNISVLMIECNYDDDTLQENMLSRKVAVSHKQRVSSSHLSLKMVLDFLKKNDISKLQEIYLLHLSDMNAHKKKMIDQIEGLAGVPVYTKGVN